MTNKKLKQIMAEVLTEFESKTLEYWYEVEFPLKSERWYDDERVLIEVAYTNETDECVSLLLCVDAEDARYSMTEQLFIPKCGEGSSSGGREFKGRAKRKKRFKELIQRLEREFASKPVEYWHQIKIPFRFKRSCDGETVDVEIRRLKETDTHVGLSLMLTHRGDQPEPTGSEESEFYALLQSILIPKTGQPKGHDD